MSTPDRDAERARRRAQEACGTFEVPAPSLCPQPDPRGRREASCDVQPDCTPDEPQQPSASVPITYVEPPDSPLPVVVRNATPILTCADIEGSPDHGGPSSPLIDIALETEFSWNEVPDITDNQLVYLGTLAAVQMEAIKGMEAVEIRDLTRLTLEQATYARERITALQTDLDESAMAAAMALMDCWWENGEQVVTCEQGMKFNTGSYTVVPGTIISKSSQEDADAQALVFAQTQLDCWWESTVTLDCEFPTHGDSSTATARSLVSQEDADTLALLAATANMEPCLYWNEERLMYCDYQAFWENDTSRIYEGDSNIPLTDQTQGPWRVVVPAESFEAETQEEANALADEYGASLLYCRAGNKELRYECPPDTYFNLLNQQVTKAASAARTLFRGEEHTGDMPPDYEFSPPAVVVLANTFLSEEGYADADLQAEEALDALKSALQCIYCNDAVLPDCPTDAGEIAATNKTQGIDADTLCGDNLSDVMVIAYQTAGVPVSKISDDDCLLCDYPLESLCGKCIKGGDDGCQGMYDAKYEPQLLVEHRCVVPADTTSICGELDEQAIVDAITAIVNQRVAEAGECAQCEFGNRHIQVYCGFMGTGSPVDTELREMLENMSPWPLPDDIIKFGEINDDPYLKDVMVDVPANKFKSGDPVLADMDAIRYAQSVLQCLYKNPTLRVYCGAGDTDVEMATLIAAAKYMAPNIATRVTTEGTDPEIPTLVECGLLNGKPLYTLDQVPSTMLAPNRAVLYWDGTIWHLQSTYGSSEAVYDIASIAGLAYDTPDQILEAEWEDPTVGTGKPVLTIEPVALDPVPKYEVHPEYQTDHFGVKSYIDEWGPLVTLPDHIARISPEAAGSPEAPVVVEANRYTSDYVEGGTYDQVLEEAIQEGLDRLDCYKLNDRMDIWCEMFSDDKDGDGIEEPWLLPENNTTIWDPQANDQAHPKVLPRGVFRSYESLEDLNAQIKEYAFSVLECTYTNMEVKLGDCAEPIGKDGTMNYPVIPEGTVRHAETPDDANSQAVSLATSMQVCISPDQIGGGDDGSPGGDGKQADCQGECFGYYS